MHIYVNKNTRRNQVYALQSMSGMTVAAVKHEPAADYLKQFFPSIKLKTVSSAIEAFGLLQFNQADAAVINKETRNWCGKEMNLYNIKSVGIAGPALQYSLAVHKEYSNLYRLIKYTLDTLSSDQHEIIQNRSLIPSWQEVNIIHSLLKTAGIILLFLCLVVIVFAVWTYCLKKQVMATSLELRESYLSRNMQEQQFLRATKLNSLGTLAGGVCHDLNTIINVIMGHSEKLLQQFDSSSANFHHTHIIYSATQKAHDVVENLLQFIREEPKSLEFVDLNASVASCLPLINEILPQSVSVRFQPNSESYIVKASNINVTQIVLNLCTNAAKAMHKNGIITIRTERVQLADSEDMLLPCTPGTYISLIVHDTGSGVSSAIRAKIMQPLFSFDREKKGTGMGLAIIHDILQQIGGGLALHSSSQGSAFIVYFPIVESETLAYKKESRLMDENSHGSKESFQDLILIIVKCADQAEIMGNFYKKIGFSVCIMHDCSNVCRLLDDKGENPYVFRLVLLDEACLMESDGVLLRQIEKGPYADKIYLLYEKETMFPNSYLKKAEKSVRPRNLALLLKK